MDNCVRNFIHEHFGNKYVVEEIYSENELSLMKIYTANGHGKTIVIWDDDVFKDLKDNDDMWQFNMNVLFDKIQSPQGACDMEDMIRYFLELEEAK